MANGFYVFQGMDVVFRLGIAILQTSQEELLSMDMEGMLQVKLID